MPAIPEQVLTPRALLEAVGIKLAEQRAQIAALEKRIAAGRDTGATALALTREQADNLTAREQARVGTPALTPRANWKPAFP